MVEFHSAVGAVKAAVEVQRRTVEHESGPPADRRIRFRIGVTTGDVIVGGDEIYGRHINVAARIQAMCEPGGVWLADAVYKQIRGKLDIACEAAGTHRVKNIDGPVGDAIRITAQLIDGHGGAHVWADRCDIGPSEIPAAQDKIVQRVAAILFSEVWQTEKRLAPRSPPDSFDAYTLAMKGLALEHRFTPEAYREGRQVLRRAREPAPNFAPAWA